MHAKAFFFSVSVLGKAHDVHIKVVIDVAKFNGECWADVSMLSFIDNTVRAKGGYKLIVLEVSGFRIMPA